MYAASVCLQLCRQADNEPTEDRLKSEQAVGISF